MKRTYNRWCLLLLLATTANLVHAQQTQVTNVTSKEYQQQFNKLVASGYRPVKIWSKTLGVFDYEGGERPQLGYWATFEKRPNSTPWVSRHGINQATYQQEFEKWTRQGYMPTDINVAFMNGQTSYCFIFDKIPNQRAWQARHGLNTAVYNSTNSQLIQQGYRRTITSFCNTPGGRVFAALWTK